MSTSRPARERRCRRHHRAPARHDRSRRPILTSPHRGLDHVEWATTAVAAVISTVLYLNLGHPYLARGVVGDLLGFIVLSAVLAVGRHRVRHEALVCLAAIGVVWSLSPDWPLRLPGAFWWAAVGLGLGVYLTIRQQRLA